MITKWKFYVKKVMLGGEAVKSMWHEVDHELAQELLYASGIHCATPHIKRMMHYNQVTRLGNVFLKMEEMPV